MKIGIVGFGYWGPNLLRNFWERYPGSVSWCCDPNRARLDLAHTRYPEVRTTEDYQDCLRDRDTEAVVVATPVRLHHPIALAALRAGRHVLIEKPMCRSVREADELLEEADKRRLTVMVDHTFIYTGAIRKIKELLDDGSLGRPYYYDSIRVNLGLFQHDVSVVWDLGPHDISILQYLFGLAAGQVQANGISHTGTDRENIAFITIRYPGDFIAHINVNWLSPVKVRLTLIAGSNKMIVYDDMENDCKVKIYDRGISVDSTSDLHQMLISYRSGDMYAPKLEMGEALSAMCRDFVESIRERTQPRSSGQLGREVVRILAAAEESLKQGGSVVKL